MAQFQLKDLDFVEPVAWESEQLHGGYYATADASSYAEADADYGYGIIFKSYKNITAYGYAAGAAGAAAAGAASVNGKAKAYTSASVYVKG